jgi:DNA-binding PadR family transcriptional regulator
LIEERTKQALQIEEGSLYPALYRMTNRGWIEFEWGRSVNNRRIKSYRLTVSGRKRLKAEAKSWAEFTVAVARVLEQPA